MRKVVVSEFVSLDGVMENPAWTFPYWSDQIAQFKQEEMLASDALLLGRVTYEGFAEAWPGRTDEAGYADRMNGNPKHVVSTTLDKAEWTNSSIIKGDVAGEVAKLKAQPGKDLLVFGSCQLVNTLLEQGLVDQYNLLVYPVVVGTGKRLFAEGQTAGLKLVESKVFDTGVVALVYQPAPKEEGAS